MNSPSNKKLAVSVLARLAFAVPIVGLFLFLPAGTLRYWQAWMYLGTLFIPMFFVFGYLLKNDPDLLERRMHTKGKRNPAKPDPQIWISSSLSQPSSCRDSTCPLWLVKYANHHLRPGRHRCFCRLHHILLRAAGKQLCLPGE